MLGRGYGGMLRYWGGVGRVQVACGKSFKVEDRIPAIEKV